MSFSVANFITDARILGGIPTALSSTNLLAIADRELQTKVIPLLLSLREDFYSCDYYSALVANVGRYEVPRRAMGGRIRALWLQRSDGTLKSLRRVTPEEAHTLTLTALGEPECYWLQGGEIRLNPLPADGSAFLKYLIHARPGRMFETVVVGTNISSISGITYSGGNFLVAVYASGGMTGYSGPVDIINSGIGGSEIRCVDMTPSAVTANQYTFPQSYGVPSDLAAAGALFNGDYIVQAETTPYVPVPGDSYSLLLYATVAAYLRSAGYLDEAAAMADEAKTIARDMHAMLSPRTDGRSHYVTGGVLGAQRAAWPYG